MTPLVLLLVLGLGVAIALSRVRTGRVAALRALERVDARSIELSPQWFDFDRDTVTFDVRYTTRDGRRHTNRCKVAVSPFAEATVYWADDLRGAERGT